MLDGRPAPAWPSRAATFDDQAHVEHLAVEGQPAAAARLLEAGDDQLVAAEQLDRGFGQHLHAEGELAPRSAAAGRRRAGSACRRSRDPAGTGRGDGRSVRSQTSFCALCSTMRPEHRQAPQRAGRRCADTPPTSPLTDRSIVSRRHGAGAGHRRQHPRRLSRKSCISEVVLRQLAAADQQRLAGQATSAASGRFSGTTLGCAGSAAAAARPAWPAAGAWCPVGPGSSASAARS